MGEWGHTVYVHSSRRSAVARALAEVLAPEYTYEGEGPTGAALEAVIIPAGAWTVVKTSEWEVLCARRDGASRPRLAEMTMRLGRSAFSVSLYDGDSVTVLEATPKGRILVSGGEGSTGSRSFHDEKIKRQHHFAPRLHLLQVPAALSDLVDEGCDPQEICAYFLPDADPYVIVTDAIFADEPEIEGARWLSFARARTSGLR